jgi:SNF2 family DNA or RNA helicase
MAKLLSTRILREHQIEMLRYCLNTQYPALFVDPRLGKTLPIIRKIKSLGFQNNLIVAPYSALYGWQEQLQKDGCSSNLLSGDRETRLLSLRHSGQFTLVNKEAHLIIPEIATIHWDSVIADESTFLKSPSSLVSQFYTKNFRDCKMRAVLTGTPAPESELEYFQQLLFLNPAILQSASWWAFRAKYFRKAINDDHLWFISKQGREFLGRQLAKHCFFMKRAEVHLGGEKIYQVRKVILPSDAQKIYDKCEEDFILDLPAEKPELTKWAMQKFIWMRRITGGFIYNKCLHDTKVKALLEMIDGEFAGEQLIIWCQFIEELQGLYAALKKYKIACIHGGIQKQEREQIRQFFQQGKTRLLLLQPECFRHGTDLSAAATMIYYSSPLGLETRQQTEDRFVDISKNDSLLVIDLVVENSVDEDIVSSLKKKYRRGEMMAAIINGCKGREMV